MDERASHLRVRAARRPGRGVIARPNSEKRERRSMVNYYSNILRIIARCTVTEVVLSTKIVRMGDEDMMSSECHSNCLEQVEKNFPNDMMRPKDKIVTDSGTLS
ncbi:hypothetical protein EVAR_29408_1 [Eumeta japonica]|uniref:Uncharacterized protein n=1 Tax=Eumeta variegata TaxID=151549 RepID=A0A4C1VTM0_EUMVA|nr:hypothetical protein EVAR_29408_1 [Eumeta japonica]